MRIPCRMVAEVLALLEEAVRPGVTTRQLEQIALEYCKKHRAKPAFKGYGGFPNAICASPNEQIVHGFATDKPLAEGDILSVDFGVLYKGFYGDAARTFAVGDISAADQHLLNTTWEALYQGINQAQPGNHLSDIGHAVQAYVEKEGFSVVRDFVGHGIGRQLHEDPQVPNYGQPGKGVVLKEGMTLAIEPMINAGSPKVHVWDDGWAAVTADGKRSAHFEQSIALTAQGPEILTQL